MSPVISPFRLAALLMPALLSTAVAIQQPHRHDEWPQRVELQPAASQPSGAMLKGESLRAVWEGTGAWAVQYDGATDEAFVATVGTVQQLGASVQRVLLTSPTPTVVQNYSLGPNYDSVRGLFLTSSSLYALVVEDDNGFVAQRVDRRNGSATGSWQLNKALLVDVAVWNATVPEQMLVFLPTAMASSINPDNNELLAQWTGGIDNLDIHAAAFIPTNSSSFLDRTACVVLVHQNTSDLSFSVLTVGCDNTLLSSFPLPEYTHLIGSVRVSADGGSVFVLSEMVADDSAVDGSWFQFAQYELSSGRLLWEQRDLWEQEWAPQQYFAVGRAGAELLCVNLMSSVVESLNLTTQPQQSVKPQIAAVPTSSHLQLNRPSDLAPLPATQTRLAALVVATNTPNNLYVLDAADGHLLTQLPTLDMMACWLTKIRRLSARPSPRTAAAACWCRTATAASSCTRWTTRLGTQRRSCR